jgi:hypothetical protein
MNNDYQGVQDKALGILAKIREKLTADYDRLKEIGLDPQHPRMQALDIIIGNGVDTCSNGRCFLGAAYLAINQEASNSDVSIIKTAITTLLTNMSDYERGFKTHRNGLKQTFSPFFPYPDGYALYKQCIDELNAFVKPVILTRKF